MSRHDHSVCFCRVAKAMLSQGKSHVESLRRLFEDALDQCGLHMTEGYILWDAYLEFEMSLDEPPCRDDERIEKIFSRYFEIPFSPDVVERTKDRFVAWSESGELSHKLAKSIERAQRAFSLRQDYEASLTAARVADPQGASFLSLYYSYIKLEISGGIHGRVRMMFERAIADFPSSEFLWKSLLTYEECAGRHDQLPGLHSRAVRHCYWSGDIWSIYIHQKSRLGIEKNMEALDTILHTAQSKLDNNPLEYQKALLARAFSLRSSGSDHTSTYEQLLRSGINVLRDKNVVDPDHLCATFLSHSLADGGDFEAGKAVWESLVSDGCIDSQYSGTWISYYKFIERFVGSFQEARNVFKRSISTQMGLADHAYLVRMWISLERERGDHDSLREAELLTNDIQREYEASQLGINRDFEDVSHAVNLLLKESKKTDANAKRKRESHLDDDIVQKTRSKIAVRNHKITKNPQGSKYIVFMKHIVPSVTENDLLHEFASCGDDMDITIGRDPKTDRSKGYAYIRCDSKATFDNLCALDGKEFQGRCLFIAPSASRKGKKQIQEEKNEQSHINHKETSQKQRLAPSTKMIPRAAVVGAPKSNDDFRKMFLSRKSRDT